MNKSIFLKKIAQISSLLDRAGFENDSRTLDDLLLKLSQTSKKTTETKKRKNPEPSNPKSTPLKSSRDYKYVEPDFNYNQIYEDDDGHIIFPIGTSADIVRDAIEIQMDDDEKRFNMSIDSKKFAIDKEIVKKYENTFRDYTSMSVEQIPKAPTQNLQIIDFNSNKQNKPTQNLQIIDFNSNKQNKPTQNLQKEQLEQQPQQKQKTQNSKQPPSKKEPKVPNIKKAPKSQFEINPSDTGASLPKDMIFKRVKEKNYKFDESFNQVIQQAIKNNLSVRDMYQDLYNKNPNYANNLIAYFRTIAPYKNPNDKVKELWNK